MTLTGRQRKPHERGALVRFNWYLSAPVKYVFAAQHFPLDLIVRRTICSVFKPIPP